MLLFILIFSIFISSLYSFNYQTVEHWRNLKQDKTTYRTSYFGYSLAVHRSSLLVGAPRDHSPHDIISRRGAVWKCEFQKDSTCQRIPFRRDGEANVRVGTSFDNKTDQWLGASLAANDGNIIAGAPFLKHRINDGHTLEYEIPGGARIGKYGRSLSMVDNTQIFSPSFLNWHSRNYNQEGYGEFGFQVALSDKPERIVITSPGSFYFRGGVHSIPLLEKNWVDTRHPFTSPHYQWRDAGWLRYPSNYSSNEYDDWCYRGYALALGNFNHDDDQEIVVSVPKLDNYRGAVEIMNSNLDEYSIRTINGIQMGEYFGASLCVLDMNNDGLDDLVVGAPLYTVKKDGRIISDAGRVDVFYQTRQHNLVRKQSIEGTRERGRFGHAIANLGDIDKDGFSDIAVSTPFGGNNDLSNAVYIYRGSKDGFITKPSQILRPTSTKGFGWALQGQFDYDNNGYPDLAISSIHSETVTIILSRPVLRLQTKLHHSTPTIPLNCTLRSDDACFILTVCIYLNDQNYQISKRDTLTYELQLDKDKEQSDKRLLFRESYRSFKKRQVKLSQRVCHDYSLYMKEDVSDKLKPIRIHIGYSLSTRSDLTLVPPILDPDNSSYDYNIPIQKDCGSDDICVPNLHISTANWPSHYKVGLTKHLLLDINVVNTGENAYDTRCFIQLPSGIEYVSSNSSSIGNLYCFLMKQSDRTLVCQIGNPLVANGNVSFQIHTAVNNYSAIQSDPFVFFINITSDNPDTKKLTAEIVVPILSTPELVVVAVAKPEQIASDTSESSFVRYTSSKINDLEIVHTYTLYNKGPSDAKRTEVKFMWPMLPAIGFNEQTPLLYGIDLPNIIRVSDPKSNADRCHIYHSSSYQIPQVEKERNNYRSFFDKFRPNPLLQETSTIDRYQDSTVPMYCHGPLCKTFICYIDPLPIGHSVIIQLKAMFRYNYFQSKVDRSKRFFIVSNATAQVREIPFNFSKTNIQQQPIVQLKLETEIPPIVERSSQNWVWLIGLSITAGVILLIILVGVLWCCGFFKRNRPKYPLSDLNESQSHQSPPSHQSGRHDDSDEISSDDNEMMIENPVESLPIVVPQHSSQFTQQQQQRTPFIY